MVFISILLIGILVQLFLIFLWLMMTSDELSEIRKLLGDSLIGNKNIITRKGDVERRNVLYAIEDLLQNIHWNTK